MTDSKRDLIVGCVLLLISAVWSTTVYQTIPTGAGEGDVGPRAFPLVVGLALGVFALVLVFRQIRPDDPANTNTNTNTGTNTVSEPTSLAGPLLTLAHIVGYGFLMTRVGFVIATFVTVLSVMLICVRERSPLRIGIASFGITLGCWLLFAKVLGVYLATGSWINLG